MIYNIETDSYRFDFVLASLVLVTWLKFFLTFRFTRTFGPMFKVLMEMIVDLAKFLVLWVVLILLFTCVSLVFFSQNDNFRNFEGVFMFFIQASIGSYSMSVFTMESESAEELGLDIDQDVFDDQAKFMTNFGQYFMIVFLLINLVLMLNFVIAILSSTFG